MIEKDVRNNVDVKMWEKWAEKSSSFFAGLVDGSVIGIFLGETEDIIILLEKKNSKIMVKTKNTEDIELPVADIIFKIKEENIGAIIRDRSFIKFMELLSNEKIKVYRLRSQLELIDKGYTGFLGRLGLNFGGGCCGSGSCC